MGLVPSIYPDAGFTRPVTFLVQHRHRRVVGVDRFGRQDHRNHQLIQRQNQFGRCRQPPAGRRTRDHVPAAAQDVLLPIQRQVVAVLVGDHLGQQARAGQTLLDRLSRLAGGLDVPLALAAGICRADVLDHVEFGRFVFELLAGLLADAYPHLTAAGALLLLVGQIVDHLLAGQFLG